MSHNRQFDSLSPLETLEQFPGWLMRYLQGDKKPDLTGPEYGPVRPPTGPVHGPERPPAPTKKAPTPPTPAARMRERSSGTPANLKMPAGLASIPDSPPAQKKGVPGTSGFSYTPNPSDFKPPQLRRPPLPEIPRVEPMNFVPPNLVGGARPHVQGPSPNAPIPTQPVAQAQEGNISPNTPQRSNDDLRAMLYAQLMAKLQGGSESRDNMNLMNSFAANLQKNANYVGSIGGNVGTNTSMTDMANDIRQQGAAKQSDQDKVREYLLGQMQKKDEFDVQMKNKQEALDAMSGRTREANETRKNIAEAANKTRIEAAKIAAEGKKVGRPLTEFQKIKLINDFDKKLDPTQANISSAMGRHQNILNEANIMLAAIERVETTRPGGQPDNRDMEDIALATAKILQGGIGGAPAQSIVKKLVPNTAGSTKASILEWLTDKPQGNDQRQFMLRMKDMIQEMKHQTEGRIREIQEMRVETSGHIESVNPEAFKAIKDARLRADSPTPAGRSGDAEKIRKYGEKYKLTPDEAKRVLIKKGVISGG